MRQYDFSSENHYTGIILLQKTMLFTMFNVYVYIYILYVYIYIYCYGTFRNK